MFAIAGGIVLAVLALAVLLGTGLGRRVLFFAVLAGVGLAIVWAGTFAVVLGFHLQGDDTVMTVALVLSGLVLLVALIAATQRDL